MKWSEEFATGLQHIDDQHRMLFQMAEDYRKALDEGRGERVYEDLLDSLRAYTRSHFSAEEACMTFYHCPAAEANVIAHDKFTAVLLQFVQRFKTGGFDRTDARDLVDTLDRWLADHIARLDVKVKPYVKGAGGA